MYRIYGKVFETVRNKKWVLKNTPGDYNLLSKKYDIEPLLLLLAKNRGVEEDDFEEYFHPSKEHLFDPSLMKDMPEACDILRDKIAQGKKIRVIGDYDIDGVCATVILTEGLSKLGAAVDYSVPHRINDGYGLNVHLVDACIEDGIDTIVTCDNGIAAYDEIEYAVKHGITVIVTDHHEVPFETDPDTGEKIYSIPKASAVVDIKRSDETYPFKDLCGAAVSWKLLMLLEKKMNADIGAYDYVELAGFATIGDVMKLMGENRTITVLGLDAMKHSSFVGLRALMDTCKIQPEDIKCYHIGFRLGPCINATGRLDTAGRAVDLLQEKDEAVAGEYASELMDYNTQRQAMTDKGVESAVEKIESSSLKEDNVLVVYLQNVHESIAGIIAGRLREKYYKPSIVLTDAEECVKGSGRSIEGYSMFEKLNECRDLFIKFGGHPMAAGMSLDPENVDKLRDFLNSHDGLNEEIMTEKVVIDSIVPFSYINTKLVGELEKLEPVGNGNRSALFAAKSVALRKLGFMGSEKQHVRMTLDDGTGVMTGVMWNAADDFVEYLKTEFSEEDVDKAVRGRDNGIRIDITFSADINVWKDSVSVQLHVKDYRRG